MVMHVPVTRKRLLIALNLSGPVQVGDDGGSEEEKEGVSVSEALSELSLQPFCVPQYIVKVGVAVLSVTHLVCIPVNVQRTHISALPTEIMRYILYLMVVADLDFHSLEQVAMVSVCVYPQHHSH